MVTAVRGGGLRRRRLRLSGWVLVAGLALLSCGSDAENKSTLRAGQEIQDGNIPLPPFALSASPSIYGTPSGLYLWNRGRSAVEELARYDFDSGAWSSLPRPPAVETGSLAWTGDRLVLLGLDQCEANQCTTSKPVVAGLSRDGKKWDVIATGLGEVDVETFIISTVGGEGGSAYFLVEGAKLLEVRPDDTVAVSDSAHLGGVWNACVTDAGPVVLGHASTIQGSSPPAVDAPSPARIEVFSLPQNFARGARFRAAPGGRPSAGTDDEQPAGSACTKNGVVVASASSVHDWVTDRGRWRSSSVPGGPRPPFSSPLVSASGEPVVYAENGIYRLRFAADGRPTTWRTSAFQSLGEGVAATRALAVAGERVVLLEQPAGRASDTTIRILEV